MGRHDLPSLTTLVLAGLLATEGCTASRPPAALPASLEPWTSPIERAHPLVGKVYDVGRGRSIGLDDLANTVGRADFVLLGEQHDNVDHHRLQAQLLSAMLASGRKPAVAFEQIDLERQEAVNAVLDATPWPAPGAVGPLATRVAGAANWQKSGWPPFDQYRPVFETALAAGLPICAANLSRDMMNRLLLPAPSKASGRAGTPAFRDAGLLAEVVLPDEARASMAADIEDSHCGYASEKMVATMVEAQRRRDAVMADSLGIADSRAAWGGAVLVAGFGHVRKDYGVPLYVRRVLPGRSVVSVAFLEVAHDASRPEDYAALLHARELPFDYVVFTPRADDHDPCEKFRKGLEKLKKKR